MHFRQLRVESLLPCARLCGSATGCRFHIYAGFGLQCPLCVLVSPASTRTLLWSALFIPALLWAVTFLSCCSFAMFGWAYFFALGHLPFVRAQLLGSHPSNTTQPPLSADAHPGACQASACAIADPWRRSGGVKVIDAPPPFDLLVYLVNGYLSETFFRSIPRP